VTLAERLRRHVQVLARKERNEDLETPARYIEHAFGNSASQSFRSGGREVGERGMPGHQRSQGADALGGGSDPGRRTGEPAQCQVDAIAAPLRLEAEPHPEVSGQVAGVVETEVGEQ